MATLKNKASHSNTIGILLSSTDDKFENSLLRGLANSITSTGRNLICFTSGAIRSYHGFESQRNLLYDLVNKEVIDGLVISGTLGHNISHQEFLNFCKQYLPLKLVTVAIQLEGIPAVLNGSQEGITNAVSHLIVEHNLQEIAFLRGPAGHQEADERYQAYIDTLHVHNIPYKPELVFQGDYTYNSGRLAVQNLHTKKVQAIVSANDSMILGAMKTLSEYGLQIPEKISVTGFDDAEEARQSNPPLTTLHQSVYEMGLQAGKTLLEILDNELSQTPVIIPPRLIIRNSCGCSDPKLERAGKVTIATSATTPPPIL
ncbi:MAG TPA: hypothetical protein DCX54_10205 [Flavobacteriales bacterium]|nr:hypothetical protein [Flavobacteriales bacterium]